MGPAMKGFEEWTPVAYAFLVKHVDSAGEERSILFDLGTPKDLVNDFPPKVAERVKGMGVMRVEKYVSEILEENQVALDSIEAIIWRYCPPQILFHVILQLTPIAATHTSTI
jgi:glutamyl-tRNA reductase